MYWHEISNQVIQFNSYTKSFAKNLIKLMDECLLFTDAILWFTFIIEFHSNYLYSFTSRSKIRHFNFNLIRSLFITSYMDYLLYLMWIIYNQEKHICLYIIYSTKFGLLTSLQILVHSIVNYLQKKLCKVIVKIVQYKFIFHFSQFHLLDLILFIHQLSSNDTLS